MLNVKDKANCTAQSFQPVRPDNVKAIIIVERNRAMKILIEYGLQCEPRLAVAVRPGVHPEISNATIMARTVPIMQMLCPISKSFPMLQRPQISEGARPDGKCTAVCRSWISRRIEIEI